MPNALSKDLRVRVIEAVEKGMSRRAAAKLFRVAPSSAIRWVAEWRRSGRIEAAPLGGDRRSSRVEKFAPAILALLDQTPDMTLAEISDYLEENNGVRFAESVIWRCLDRHAVTYKKNSARQRAGAARRCRAARRVADTSV